ncbi:MAG: AAA family ATPase [Gammaproteobacteria bacterium]
MNITAIVNQKGGCGKTSTAINLAAVLGRQDTRVLLVDMDPQGHASLGLGVAGAELPGLYEVFKGEHELAEVIQAEVAAGIDLVPGNISLAAAEHLLAEQADRDLQLMSHLSTVSENYDYVILDCPPALGLLSINALRCADRVLIPVEPSLFAMDGIERLRETIRLLEYQHDIRPEVKLLANMFDSRTRLAREMLEMLETEIPVELCTTRIRNTVRVREAAYRGLPLTAHAPRDHVTDDYSRLAGELMGTIQRNARKQAARGASARQTGQAPEQTPDQAHDLREVVFHFNKNQGQEIQIAGEFNNWIPDQGVTTEMRKGAIEKILHVKPGGYEYRLIIDGIWQEDPANPEAVPNALGGNNSLLNV